MSELRVIAPNTNPFCKRSALGTFEECPQCSGEMLPEHAHYRCASCGWRDSCCD
jgi:hypothetical protein